MSRKKQEITKTVEFRVRVESKLKNEYVGFCKKNKLVLSKRIREIIISDMTNNVQKK